MAHYVLLHGAWHTHSTWDEVAMCLQAQGHHVSAPDFPGRSGPLKGITLQDYLETVRAILAQASEPVHLVGHSMAGIVLSELAEQAPEEIARLIYVAAFAPETGHSMLDDCQGLHGEGLSSEITAESSSNTFTLAPSSKTGEVLFSQCSQEQVAAGLAGLCVEPLLPAGTKLSLTRDRFGKVPKLYIVCQHDLAIAPVDQRRFAQRLPNATIREIACDHSPQISAPALLCEAML